MSRTLEQKRAELAWKKVEEVARKAESVQKEYRALAHKVPAMIMTSGLGPTLAFLLSKAEGENAERMLYGHISSWLKEAESIAWTSNKDNIMERIVGEDSVVYRQATKEALAFVTWLKRFAQAKLKGGIS